MPAIQTSKIKQLDKSNVAGSIVALPDQIRQVLADSKKIQEVKGYGSAKNIIVSGMGGSNLGARIIRSVFSQELKIPLSIEAGYDLPNYASKDSIVILSSYSGTTEETLSAYEQAKRRKAKLMIMTARTSGNNKLEHLMIKDKVPGYAFEPKHNPCNQPRLGVGYSIVGMLTLFIKAGLVNLETEKIRLAASRLALMNKKLSPSSNTAGNYAKRLAQTISSKIPVFVSGPFLEGNMHALRNQVNECSKNFSAYLVLPELNHYAMEGLGNPKWAKEKLHFVFFDSDLDHPRVIRRSDLTKQVVKKEGIKYAEIKLGGRTKFEQALETLLIGSWISFYLGIANNIDPAEIKHVDWFKEQLTNQ